MSEDRESAQNLQQAMKRLELTVQSLFDARQRGDVEDFDFYRAGVEKCAKSVCYWAGKIKPKAREEVPNE